MPWRSIQFHVIRRWFEFVDEISGSQETFLTTLNVISFVDFAYDVTKIKINSNLNKFQAPEIEIAIKETVKQHISSLVRFFACNL